MTLPLPRTGSAPTSDGQGPDSPRSRNAVVRGGSLLVMREAIGLVVRSAGLILLVRMIGTSAYGLYSAPVMIVTLMAAVANCGSDLFLLRSNASDDRWFDAAYAWLLVSSTGVALASIGGAELLKPLVADPGFVPVFQVLALSLPINVLWVPAKCRLERTMAFGRIAVIEVSGDVVLYGVSVPLAFAGLHQWAPVGGYIAWQTSLLVTSLILAGRRPRLLWSPSLIKEMLGYGSTATLATLILRARDALVPVVVGRFGGTSGVGIVSFAMRLLETMSFARRATARLSIVAASWLQEDRGRLRRAIEESTSLQLLALAPVVGGFALVSPWLVPRVFGQHWHDLIYIFPFLALGQLGMSLYTMHLSTMLAVGKMSAVIWSNLLRLLIVAGLSAPLGWRYGMAGASASMAISVVGFLPLELATRRFVKVSYRASAAWIVMFVPLLGVPFVPDWGVPLLILPLLVTLAIPHSRRHTYAVVMVVVKAMLRRPATR